jgi:hypothetical protein
MKETCLLVIDRGIDYLAVILKLVCNQRRLHWERKCSQPISISAQAWFFIGPCVEFYGGCTHDPPLQQQVSH